MTTTLPQYMNVKENSIINNITQKKYELDRVIAQCQCQCCIYTAITNKQRQQL